jgi:RNA polymerase sigma-70 factor (ECF subfamily)
MADANASLRVVLVERYSRLVQLLERRLRSPELAREALHDAYLHLESSKEVTSVNNPFGYLIGIAINCARLRQRSGKRHTLATEIETALDIVDNTPDPARIAEARSDLEAVERALETLPARRRAILLASFSENLPSREIAKRFGLSTRMIDKELKLAREHCAKALVIKRKKNFSNADFKSSNI